MTTKEAVKEQFDVIWDSALDLRTTLLGAFNGAVVYLGLAQDWVPMPSSPNFRQEVAVALLAAGLLLQGIYTKSR